ncbi:protein-export chaperone SecB [Mucilaginibacter sp.]|uniref:protein-export chaperone SecB n=1 Tax=Mucilaginibacter sp. TaxID=1882438 RepID=UPI003263EC63
MSEKPSYSLQHILLLDSNFTRSWSIDFDEPNFTNSVDIEVEDTRGDNMLSVTLHLTFKAGVGDDYQVRAYIKMVGIFSTTAKGELSIDQFASINAPAIIFPFIREHLSSLSVKAGINPILLSPVNFVQHSEQKKKKKTSSK